MQKLIPHVWYDNKAYEAAQWYVALFDDSKITLRRTIYDTPSGDAELVNFELAGFKIASISAGPYFELNNAVSLMVGCKNIEDVDRLYKELSKDGNVLMPINAYPFSKRYGWIQDRYGLSWQLMLDENLTEKFSIRPCLLFGDGVCGKAEEAMNRLTEIIEGSKIGFISYYNVGEAQDTRAKVNYGELSLLGTECVFMDHGYGGEESFNEALSFIISCDDQKELDYYTDQLSYDTEAEQCGWVKDVFGISWQLNPSSLESMYQNCTVEEAERMTQALLKMKRLDIRALEAAKKGF